MPICIGNKIVNGTKPATGSSGLLTTWHCTLTMHVES